MSFFRSVREFMAAVNDAASAAVDAQAIRLENQRLKQRLEVITAGGVYASDQMNELMALVKKKDAELKRLKLINEGKAICGRCYGKGPVTTGAPNSQKITLPADHNETAICIGTGCTICSATGAVKPKESNDAKG